MNPAATNGVGTDADVLIGVLEDYLKQFNYNRRAFPETRLWLCIHTLAAIERLATPAVENPTDTRTSQ